LSANKEILGSGRKIVRLASQTRKILGQNHPVGLHCSYYYRKSLWTPDTYWKWGICSVCTRMLHLLDVY